ncbi:hypothetical protein FQA39_LY05012 [Lamprigera yunnana]|nr:hypothetical protein FQA39_LY05012 [Lamprigera yunnana]
MINKVFIVYFIVLNITVVLGNKQTTIDDEYKNELKKIFNLLSANISVNDTNALEKLAVHISTLLESEKKKKNGPNEFLDKVRSSLEEGLLDLTEIKGAEDFCELQSLRLKLEGPITKLMEEIIKMIENVPTLKIF